jgi:hypothetical protein
MSAGWVGLQFLRKYLAPLLEGVRHWPPWLLTSSSTSRSGSVCTLTPRTIVAFLKLPPAEVVGGRRRRLDVCSFVVASESVSLPHPRSLLLCDLSLFAPFPER